ncbi:MAG: hypothetical protein QG614_214, partial [Patescibacteria group bacterium]|nr:hypothetical protein [Patescibacteria group bacterium]
NYCKTNTKVWYCTINGQSYNSEYSFNQSCKKYCSLNSTWYNSTVDYNNNCKQSTVYYCSLNNQTYYSANEYNNSCKKYCSYNNKWYTSITDYNVYCKPATIKPKPKDPVTTIPGVVAEKGGNAIICKDEVGNTASIKPGQKLINLAISSTQGKLVAGGVMEYSVKYNNTSSVNISNVVLSVTLPSEMKIQNSMSGAILDSNTNTIRVNVGNVAAMSSGELKVLVKVDESVQVGKTMVVSSLVTYEVLDEKGKVMADENSTNMIVTVIADNAGNSIADNNSNSDNSIGGFAWPNNILEWLIILILVAILFLLGRNIYYGLTDK